MTDQKLYELCKKYGENARVWRQKFLGLLPEVAKRELAARTRGESWLKRRGYTSIFEFAAKLAGVSEEQVRNVLNLERQFADKPLLRSLLVEGQVSVNKLVRIASIATRENETELSRLVMNVSKKALETLVRDVRRAGNESDIEGQPRIGDALSGSAKSANMIGSQKPFFEVPELPGQPETSRNERVNNDWKLLGALSPEVKNKLLDLAEKGIDINELVSRALERRDVELAQEKEEIAEQELAERKQRRQKSRYLSVKLRRVMQKEHGTKCSMPGCERTAGAIHHTRRFALTRSHDPRYLAPLCAAHHELAHAVDLQTGKNRRNR